MSLNFRKIFSKALIWMAIAIVTAGLLLIILLYYALFSRSKAQNLGSDTKVTSYPTPYDAFFGAGAYIEFTNVPEAAIVKLIRGSKIMEVGIDGMQPGYQFVDITA